MKAPRNKMGGGNERKLGGRFGPLRSSSVWSGSVLSALTKW